MTLFAKLAIRLGHLEEALFGSAVSNQGVLPRLEALERAIFDELKSGALLVRVQGLEAAAV